MDYIPKTVKGDGRGGDGGENERGTKSQRGGKVRREWNGEGAPGGLSLHFCPGPPEIQVTPLHMLSALVPLFHLELRDKHLE